MRLRRMDALVRCTAAMPVVLAALFPAILASGASPEAALLDRLPNAPGIAVLLDPQPAELAIAMAGRREWTIYCQLPSDAQVALARQRVDRAGLLGTRIYVEKGPWSRVHLADNLADAVIVTRQAAADSSIDRKELLRVVNPLGRVLLGDEQLTKPFPAGSDDWSHPYHGPDNNPQSRDLIARAPYLTQYFGGPTGGLVGHHVQRDNGSQFLGKDFKEFIRIGGMTASWPRRGKGGKPNARQHAFGRLLDWKKHATMNDDLGGGCAAKLADWLAGESPADAGSRVAS